MGGIVVPYVLNVRLGKNTRILTYFIMGINVRNNYNVAFGTASLSEEVRGHSPPIKGQCANDY